MPPLNCPPILVGFLILFLSFLRAEALADKTGKFSPESLSSVQDSGHSERSPRLNDQQTGGDDPTALLDRINQYRKRHQKGPVVRDDCLSTVARDHSAWMNSSKTMSHKGKDGLDPIQRCDAAGCGCSAENIARGWDAGGGIPFNLWINSPEHNAILLGPFSRIGIGVAGGYVTAVFK